MSTSPHHSQSAGENPAETMDFEDSIRDVASKKGYNDSGISLGSDDMDIANAINSLRESPATFRRPSKSTEAIRPTRKTSLKEDVVSSPSKQKRRSKSAVMEGGEDATSVASMRRRRTKSKDPQKESSPSRRSLSKDAVSRRQRSSSRDLALESSIRRLRPSASALSPRRSQSFIKSARTGPRSVVDNALSSQTPNISLRTSRTMTMRPVASRVKSKAALLESPEKSGNPHRSHSTDAETTSRTRSRSRDASTRVHRSRSRDASSRAMESPGRLNRLSKRSTSSTQLVSTHSRGDVPGPPLESSKHHCSTSESGSHEKHNHHSSSRHHDRTDDDEESMASTMYSMEPSRGAIRSHSSDAVLENESSIEARHRLRGRRPRPEKSASLPATAFPLPEASPGKATSSRSFRRKVGSPVIRQKTLEASPKITSPKQSRASPSTTDKSSRSSCIRSKPSPNVEKPSSSSSLESERPILHGNDSSPAIDETPCSVVSQCHAGCEMRPSSCLSLESERPISDRSNPSPTASEKPSYELSVAFPDFGTALPLQPPSKTSTTIMSKHSDTSPTTLHTFADFDIDMPTFPSTVSNSFADLHFDSKPASNRSISEKHSSAHDFHEIDRPSSDRSISEKPLSALSVEKPKTNHIISEQSSLLQPVTESFTAHFDNNKSSKLISVRSKASFIPNETHLDSFAAFDTHVHEESANKPPSLDELFAAAYEKDSDERTRTLEELFASQKPFRTDKAASVSDLFGSVPHFSVGSLLDASVCSSPAASSTADRALLKQSPDHAHSRLGNHFRIRSWGNFAALLAEPSLSSGGTRDDHSDVTSLGSGNLSSVGTPKVLRRGLKKSRSFGDVSHIISGETSAPRRGKKPTATHSIQSLSDGIMGMPEAAVVATTSAKDGEIRVIRASHTGHTTTAVEDDFELNDSSDTDHQEQQQEYLQLCLPTSTLPTDSPTMTVEPTESPLQPADGSGLFPRRFRGTTPVMGSTRKTILPTFRGRQRKEDEDDV